MRGVFVWKMQTAGIKTRRFSLFSKTFNRLRPTIRSRSKRDYSPADALSQVVKPISFQSTGILSTSLRLAK